MAVKATEKGAWHLFGDLDARLLLPAIQCELLLTEIYDKVSFA